MNLVFDFNSGWYILFFAFLLSWAAVLIIRRKSQGRREVKEQVFLAFSGLFTLAPWSSSLCLRTCGTTRPETGP